MRFAAMAVFVCALILGEAKARAETPNWSISAGVLQAGVSPLTISFAPNAVSFSVASPQFVAPTGAILVAERRIRGDLWLILQGEDSFNQETVNELPPQITGTTTTSEIVVQMNTLALAIGLRHGFSHPGRFTFSWFAMIRGGWSYQASYLVSNQTLTTPLAGSPTNTGSSLLQSSGGSLAGTFSAGFAVDVSLIENISLEVSSTALSGGVIATPSSADGVTLQSVWFGGLVFQPAVLFRVAF